MIATLFLAGLLVSLFHVFVTKEKGPITKIFMLVFALLLSGVSGIAAAVHMIRETSGVLLAFPIWNIINGLILLWYVGMVDDSRVKDADATPLQVAVGLLTAGVIFVVCQSVLHWHWSITLPVCIAYATNMNRYVQKLVRHLCRSRS
jgi:hypothetical protein